MAERKVCGKLVFMLSPFLTANISAIAIELALGRRDSTSLGILDFRPATDLRLKIRLRSLYCKELFGDGK